MLHANIISQNMPGVKKKKKKTTKNPHSMWQKTPSQCDKNGYFILVKCTINHGYTIGNYASIDAI